MKTVFIIGAPSAGKTVLAARLYAHLLMKGERVIHIPETVSLMIRQGLVKNIGDIPQRQILDDLYDKKNNYTDTELTDYMIAEDNPLASRLYASNLYSSWNTTFEDFRPCCYIKINLDIFPEMYDESTRIHTFQQSLQLDREIDDIIEDYKLPCLKVTRSTPLEIIVSWINVHNSVFCNSDS